MALVAGAAACIRGSLPAREFYRITPVDSLLASDGESGPAQPPALQGTVAVLEYDTPGLYGTNAIVFRVGASRYGTYPSREWAIPLGEMLGSLTERVARARRINADNVSFTTTRPHDAAYEWRGEVREFDEVDGPTAVSASVTLAARLVRTADDSVVWSGSARAAEPVAEARSMDAVIAALSRAATRAVAQLADDASAVLRRVPAARAHQP